MLLIAEIGLNHDGNFDLARNMIRQAKLAGCDLVKFQFGWRDKPGEINCIDLDTAKRLKKWAAYCDIEMFASVITPDGYKLARDLGMNRYKIASRTVIDYPDMCREVIAEGKPTYVSLGMWEGPEFPFGPPNDELRYIFCKSKYPMDPEDVVDLPKSFSPAGFWGYSDHFQGIEVCLLAIARGAQFVEKHFTLNKASQVIRDHVLSGSPEEFRFLSTQGRALSRLVKSIPS